MKHKLLYVWVIVFFVVLVLGVANQMYTGQDTAYGANIMISGIVLVLGCPISLLDFKLASRSLLEKGTQKFQQKTQRKDTQLRLKKLELEEKTIELEHRDLEIERKNIEIQRKGIQIIEKEAEIEALRKQRTEITEDDIRVSKEKHFCLVHKGTITGYSYICPDCGAFYCLNCVEAIKEIENECWSCGNILDTTLSSKKVEAPFGTISTPETHKKPIKKVFNRNEF